MSLSVTVKLPGWQPQPRPPEDQDIKFHRQLLTEIVFGLFHRKKEILERKGMPSQPVSLREIWLEYLSRKETLKQTGEWSYKEHMKRWIDRRVNEIASPEYGENGVPKIVAATAGYYEPNPKYSRC